MFDSLSDSLRSAIKNLRGKGKMSEANMRDGLTLVEQSLLDADVAYAVVRDFMARVTEKALGQKVLLALDPSEQVVSIVHQELVNVLGPVDPTLHLRRETTVIMMCGLQGSGKTTTCGKLARLIQQEKKKPLLVAADLQRPAAIQQLHVIGEQLGVSVYSEPGAADPVKVCRNAVAKARASGEDVVILDTAGRLAIDKELMDQLKLIDRQVQPDQVFLVVDGMTGQDAVNSAKAFEDALELDGVIMTKLDGDARGGALLSVKQVTGVPIKFIGTGEQLGALEPFYPERMAGRILGLGDILTMVETAQREFDQDKMREAEAKLRGGQFTLDDFRKHLEQLAKPGLLQKMLGLLPGMGEIRKMMGELDPEHDLKRVFGIIDSMTKPERFNPNIIDPNRRRRIARGAGVEPQEVNALVKQFDGMRSMMQQMAGKSASERMRFAQEFQKSGMLDPGAQFQRVKGTTGKRLTAKERADQRDRRERELRRRKRDEKHKKK